MQQTTFSMHVLRLKATQIQGYRVGIIMQICKACNFDDGIFAS